MNINATTSTAAVAVTQTPAQKPQSVKTEANKPTLVTDSVKLGAKPQTGKAVKEGIKFEAGAYAKAGAVIGAVGGGITVPLLTYALTMGAPLSNPKLAWGSLAVGVLGGAAVGAAGGALSGTVSGAIDGFIASHATSKGSAQLTTGLVAGVSSAAWSYYKDKSVPKALINGAISGGIGAYVGGVIYNKAMAHEAAK